MFDFSAITGTPTVPAGIRNPYDALAPTATVTPNPLINNVIPTDHTAIGSGLASLLPEQQGLHGDNGLLDYYTQSQDIAGNAVTGSNYAGTAYNNLGVLGAYLDGTYFDEGNVLPGTSISNTGQFFEALGLTDRGNGLLEGDLSADTLSQYVSPQILSDARDWEQRDITRSNIGNVWDNFAGLAPAALLAGGFGATVGFGGAAGAAGGGFVNPGGLGLSPANLYNPASLGGAVAPSSGLGLTGANLFNPAILGGAIPNVTTPVVGGGFVNPNGLGLSPADLYNPASLGGTPPPIDGVNIDLPDRPPTPPDGDPTPDNPGIDLGNLPIPQIPGGVDDSQVPASDPFIPPIPLPQAPITTQNPPTQNNPSLPDIPTALTNYDITSTSPFNGRYQRGPLAGPPGAQLYFSRFQEFPENDDMMQWLQNPYLMGAPNA